MAEYGYTLGQGCEVGSELDNSLPGGQKRTAPEQDFGNQDKDEDGVMAFKLVKRCFM